MLQRCFENGARYEFCYLNLSFWGPFERVHFNVEVFQPMFFLFVFFFAYVTASGY